MVVNSNENNADKGNAAWLWPISLVFIAFIVLGFHLGQLPLLDRDETRYTWMAKVMLEKSDWVVTWLNHQPHLAKPPLFVWLLAGVFKVLGISEWSARLVPLAAGVGTVLLTYAAGALLWNRRTGFMAGLILIFSPLFWGLSRFVVTDMTLTLWTTLGIVSFLYAIHRQQYNLCYLAYAAWGLAFLTKGPVGVAIPLFIIIAYMVRLGIWRQWRLYKPFTGLLVFLAVAIPWYILVEFRIPGYLKYFFIEENLLRFATKMHKRYEPFWFFVPVVILGMFPWTLLLWQAIRPKDGKTWLQHLLQPTLFLCLFWFGVGFILFSMSGSKLPTYILPYLIPLALLLGAVIDQGWSGRKISYWGIISICLVVSVGLLAAGYLIPVAKLGKNAANTVSWPMTPEAVILGVMGVFLSVLVYIRKSHWGVLVMAVGIFLLMIHAALLDEGMKFAQSNSARKTGAYLRSTLKRGDTILVYHPHRWSMSVEVPSIYPVTYEPDLFVINSQLRSIHGRVFVWLRKPKDLSDLNRIYDGSLTTLVQEGNQLLVMKPAVYSQDSINQLPAMGNK